MKAKVTCSVINDLLPLYADNALSGDSRTLVDEHLEECKFCRAELAQMKSTIVIEKDKDDRRLRKLKNSVGIKKFVAVSLISLAGLTVLALIGIAWGRVHFDSNHGALGELVNYFVISAILLLMFSIVLYSIIFTVLFIRGIVGKPKPEDGAVKRIGKVSAAVILTIYIAVTLGFFLTYYGSAAKADDIILRPEFQYSEDSLLEQEWVLHFNSKDGRKALNVFREVIHNSDGMATGLIYTVHEVPIKAVLESTDYTVGYSYADPEAIPPHDFDFTVTVVFKDKIISYSMRDEGLFEKQENVAFAPDTPDKPDTREVQDITARTASVDGKTYIKTYIYD